MQTDPENKDQEINSKPDKGEKDNSNKDIAKQIPTVTPDNDNDDLEENQDHED